MENASKLEFAFSNLSSYVVFDVKEATKGVKDLSCPAAQFMVRIKLAAAIDRCLESSKNLIYVNKNLTKEVIDNFKSSDAFSGKVGKCIIIDNGIMMKHKSMYSLFDEAVFYTAWKKV